MTARLTTALPVVELVAPLEPAGTGAEAFLGLASDNQLYWIKAPDNPQGSRSLIAEVVAYGLGRVLGAPVPSNALVKIPDNLGWRFKDGRTMKAGTGHASLDVPYAVVSDDWATYSDMDDNRHRQAFIFATWDLCMGGDPHWIHQVSADHSIWTIDHGFWLATETDWDLKSLRQIGVRPWQYDLDPSVASATALEQAAESVEGLSLDAIRSITDDVPLDWGTSRAELEELASLLFVRAEGVAERLRRAARQSQHP